MCLNTQISTFRGKLRYFEITLKNVATLLFVATDIRAILKFVLRSKWFCHEELEDQLETM